MGLGKRASAGGSVGAVTGVGRRVSPGWACVARSAEVAFGEAQVWGERGVGASGHVGVGLAAGGDDVHFAGDVAAGLWFEAFDFAEEPAGFAEERRVFAAFEDLHSEMPAVAEDVRDEFEDGAAELCGSFGIADAAGVRGHVAEDDVEEAVGALLGADGFEESVWVDLADVAFEEMDAWSEVGFDGFEVDADDAAAFADEFAGDLDPGAGGAAEVEHAVAGLDEVPCLVDLLELVCGAGEVALLLGELEEVIMEDAFGGLGSHG